MTIATASPNLTDDQYRLTILWRSLRILCQRCQQNEGAENYQQIGLDVLFDSIQQIGSLTDWEVQQIYADITAAINFRNA